MSKYYQNRLYIWHLTMCKQRAYLSTQTCRQSTVKVRVYSYSCPKPWLWSEICIHMSCYFSQKVYILLEWKKNSLSRRLCASSVMTLITQAWILNISYTPYNLNAIFLSFSIYIYLIGSNLQNCSNPSSHNF